MSTDGGFRRWFVRMIDRALLRHYGIFTFSEAPECVLRLGRTHASQTVTLHDGTCVAQNDALLEMHFWNERLPVMDATGATPMWGLALARDIRASLFLLAEYLSRAPAFQSVRALHAEIRFLEASQFAQLRPFVESLGFDFTAETPPGPRFWKGAFWANLYSWWLMWTFSPGSLRGKRLFNMARCELWLSRAVLEGKYGRPRR